MNNMPVLWDSVLHLDYRFDIQENENHKGAQRMLQRRKRTYHLKFKPLCAFVCAFAPLWLNSLWLNS